MKSMAPLDGRPQLTQELDVAGDQMVVPCAGSQVGADVGVEPLVLDAGSQVVIEPTAIGELSVGQPAVRAHGFFDQATHRERHRSFDVVPGIAVATAKPRDHPVTPLQVGDGMGSGQHIGRAEHARDGRDRALMDADFFGGHAAAPCFGVVGPRRPGTPRGRLGLASDRSAGWRGLAR